MLSKSQYTKYLQCPKLFWLSRKAKNKLTPVSAELQHIFDTGSRVGDLAQNLFPGGKEIPFNIKNMNGMASQTKKLIEKGESSIYEASFFYDDIFAAVDILVYSEGLWNIYEVKSSTEVKDIYLDDASIQSYVLEQLGYQIGSVNIVHINNKYIKQGELDINSLFTIVDITQMAVERQPVIPSQIQEMKKLLKELEPEVAIGPQCTDPYECSAKDYCWKTLAGIPENSVFTLSRARINKKFELYNSGIINVSDVPLDGRTPSQQLQILGKIHIDTDEIRNFLSLLKCPVTHLDFETYQQAIPEYDGLKPFQQIPFQYSMHIEEEDGVKHKEYLAPIGVDPRRFLAEKLINDIPLKGTILAYNRSFEIRVIKELASVFNDLSDSLLDIANRIEDLMTPFQKGWYYHPEMNGSYSIKNVLPALDSEMQQSYKELPVVHNGSEASSIWSSLTVIDDAEKIEKIRNGLLEYCKLDTLAMVKILNVLRNKVKL